MISSINQLFFTSFFLRFTLYFFVVYVRTKIFSFSNFFLSIISPIPTLTFHTYVIKLIDPVNRKENFQKYSANVLFYVYVSRIFVG